MFFKKYKHRGFDYLPRYYNPDKDIDEKRKKKIGFTRQLKFKKSRRNPVQWLILLLIVLYLYLKFSGLI